jgi:hypothetical protein
MCVIVKQRTYLWRAVDINESLGRDRVVNLILNDGLLILSTFLMISIYLVSPNNH